MKKTAIVLAAVLLTGCGYTHEELTTSQAICKTYHGEHSYKLFGSNISETFCTVDGVRYRIGRGNGQLLDGQVL